MGQWQVQVNVAGIQPFEPGGVRLPEGAYAVLIKDTDRKASNDPTKKPSLTFKVAVTEECEQKGAETSVFITEDFSVEFHKKHMRSLLLGVGAKPEALEQGTLNLTAEMFQGKTAYIYVQTREGKTEDGKKLYDNINFIAPTYYEKWRAEHPRGAAQARPANGAAAGAGLGALSGSGAAQPAASPFGGTGGGSPFAR